MKLFIFTSLLLPAVMMLTPGCSEQPQPPAKGALAITSIPDGAQIFLNGKLKGITPKTMTGTPARYRFRLEKDGFAPRWVETKLAAGDKSKLNVALAERGAEILITSKPSQAEVVIGGRAMGLTPLVLQNQKFGKGELQIRKTGFAVRTVSFNVTDHRPQEISINLESNVGQVSLTSTPSNARLTINGKPYGFTPFNGELESGIHQIRLEKTGTVVMETNIAVQRDGKVRKHFQLATAPGTLIVNSVPSGAQIRLDGKAMGHAPITLKDIPSGEHEVTAEKDGFDPQTRKCEITPDGKTEMELTLLSSRGELHLAVVPAGVSVYVNNKFVGVVKGAPNAPVNRTELIRMGNLKPGKYLVTVAHKRAMPREKKSVEVLVEKGKVNRPEPIMLWVPNVEVKWRATGLVETGMMYAENNSTITFGAEPGFRAVYDRKLVESIKKLNIND